ncbi:Adenine DNA glycosylase [Euphorbia peplus]|nr:Adenine DNA glycosylase [Euphorbia peplus]
MAKKRNIHPTKKAKLIQCQVPDIEDMFSDNQTQTIRANLLHWYDLNQRHLPWRRNKPNPPQQQQLQQCQEEEEEACEEEEKGKRAYGVWVSEVMLQQTRVQTVIDYYNRWMSKWPTVHDLSQASLEEVNEMWAGLGYYRRARFLLEGAKMIVGGRSGFPSTVSSLRKVPGIGDYTAGAIASIAFNEVVPVVDGNVIRVLARLKAISANPKESTTVKNFWKLAGQLVDPCRPGDFNQSLMELGATVCTVTNPLCSSCPVSGQCRASSISKQEKSVVSVTDYPTKVVKVKQRHEFSAVCVVEIQESKSSFEDDQPDSKFLLVKRPEAGLLAGLWEFPTVMVGKEADLTTRRKETDHFLKQSFRLNPKSTCRVIMRENIGEFVHIFSHIRLKVYVELLVICLKGASSKLFRDEEKEATNWKFVEKKALSTLGLTSGVRKVYNMIEKFKHGKLSTDSAPPRKRSSSSRKARK